MATQLTIVNNVLKRLREDEVDSVTDSDYAVLLAMWVNDGVKALTDQNDWESLRHVIEVDTVADQAQYDLGTLVSGGGSVISTGRVTTEHSMLEWDHATHRPLAYQFDTSASTSHKGQLRLITEEDRYRKSQADTASSVEYPNAFSLVGNPEGTGYDINIWPLPNAAKFLQFTFWTPAAELAVDGTADATDVVLNAACVEAYVHMTAANERGEEMGEPGNVLERRYISLVGAAVETAIRKDERTNRYESYRA